MKTIPYIILLAIIIGTSCTTQQKLAYLNNLSETGGEETFNMDIPDYKLQYRDILYISAKAMMPDGMITDFLSAGRSLGGSSYMQGEAGQYLLGFDINSKGEVIIPVIGGLKVSEMTLEEARSKIQLALDTVFNNAIVECKLLSFKYTVIGEVRSPGTYMNYNNYLNVLEAIGRAGGIGDYGRRDRILVVRPIEGGTKTYRLNLQDKNLLSSQAYFLLPNDVIIVEPESKKIFNLNLPTFSFILTTATSLLTTTLLLINYFGK
jgi:polysaccharide biosynthesis/export protein